MIPNPNPIPTKTDQNDESLRKWKESLGLGSGNTLPADPNDKRTVIILSLGLEVDGRPDIVIDLTKPGSLEDLNKHPFTIKEGATFRMKARFRVQHGILSGLKYVQVVSRMGVKSKMQEMIVSFLSFFLFFSFFPLSFPPLPSYFRNEMLSFRFWFYSSRY